MASKGPRATGRKTTGGAMAEKTKKLSQKEQSERFIETARSLGVTDEEFARTLDIVLPIKPGAGPK